MKVRWLFAAPLLAFVAASVVALVVREVRPAAASAAHEAEGPGHKVVVYYFHGAKRCVSCRKIEALADEAVHEGFPSEVKDGRLAWRVEDFDAPGNEHFVKDYAIGASTVVVVQMRDGKPVQHKNLEAVWDHLDDRDGLIGLVRQTVESYLKGAVPAPAEKKLPRGLLAGAALAFWLGILTSVSPCPLATNIAALSFIGRRVGNPRSVLLSGLLYTGGRAFAYLVLAVLIAMGILASTQVNALISKYLNRFLGPILILIGMLLLAVIELGFATFTPGEKTQRRAEVMGVWGAGLLGILFALAFCPLSLVYFLGVVDLCASCRSPFIFPLVYGVATALPVAVFAFLIAFSAQSIGKVFNRLSQFELWARRITGGIFILVGVYFCLIYVFGLSQG